MSAEEFVEWWLEYRRAPWGERREDLRSARLCWLQGRTLKDGVTFDSLILPDLTTPFAYEPPPAPRESVIVPATHPTARAFWAVLEKLAAACPAAKSA